MKRFAAILIVLVLFSACNVDHLTLGSYDKNTSPNTSESSSDSDISMDELTIRWYGYVNPQHFEKTITVDAGRHISLEIKLYSNETTVADSCKDSTEITEGSYKYILGYVKDADLLYYEPSVGQGDGFCTKDHGYKNLGVTYKDSDGSQNSFDTSICYLDDAISNLAGAVSSTADINTSNCSEDELLEEN
ncbi:MAG: hypothetical protein ABH871_04355 [Pseudomonadota bacterium]